MDWTRLRYRLQGLGKMYGRYPNEADSIDGLVVGLARQCAPSVCRGYHAR
jgi:hypothetical protein